MNTEAEKISVPRFLTLFRKFSSSEKVKIAEQIDQETFAERWTFLDSDLPDIEISEEDIMDEVRAVRYGKNNIR